MASARYVLCRRDIGPIGKREYCAKSIKTPNKLNYCPACLARGPIWPMVDSVPCPPPPAAPGLPEPWTGAPDFQPEDWRDPKPITETACRVCGGPGPIVEYGRCAPCQAGRNAPDAPTAAPQGELPWNS